MRRSFSHYTHVLYIPLLAVGLIMVGCDDGSPGPGDGENGNDSAITESFPAPSDGAGYAEETAINIQSSGLGIRLEGDNPSSSTLNAIYDGSVGDIQIQLIPSGVTPSASTYGELAAVADVKSQIQNFSDPLLRSDQLEAGVDAPSSPSGNKTADELISFYLDQAQHTSENGVDFSQFSEKGVSSALTYADATGILRDFADDGSVSGDAEAKWNEAFGHFGAPRNFGAFFDTNAEEGLSGGAFQNVNGDDEVNLVTEGVYIWAGYTAERAAAAEATGNSNNFAATAFNAFVDGRNDVDDGNAPSDDAQTILDAWEATVAVNVIHYSNSMLSALDGVEGTFQRSNVNIDDAWGEAKVFVWTLQFHSPNLSEDQLKTIHDKIGSKPPYAENNENPPTASAYSDDLNEVKQTIQDAYGFNSENVSAW